MSFSFQITKQSRGTRARRGKITTAHGVIETPVFMPVGTVGTVKAMRTDELADMGAQIILGNTYHLYLRPGHELVQKMGGLHQFMNWKGPILTDSGGYQVFSLGRAAQERQGASNDEPLDTVRSTKLAKVTPDGVEFLSHIDGQKHFMTPELSIQIQQALGSDIMMVFDECTPYPATLDEARKSMELSLKWEERSLKQSLVAGRWAVRSALGPSGGSAAEPSLVYPSNQALFAIIQGGMYPELRKECLERLMEISDSCLVTSDSHNEPLVTGYKSSGFSGYAVGGLSVGEPMPLMYEMAEAITSHMPENKPRYLMGVGMPQDIITCIDYGVDMFDCVIPTRNARNGMLFTPQGFIYIKQAQFAEDPNPIDESCTCYTCRNYSRAYLRHLHMAKEILSSILSTIHNLHYYLNLLQQARLAIEEDRYPEFKRDFFSRLQT